MGRKPFSYPQRPELIRAIVRAEEFVREVASRLHLPGRDRLDLIVLANELAAILERDGSR